MKIFYRLSIIVLFVFAFFAIPTNVSAQSSEPGDKVIFGGTYSLKSDEVLEGSLIVFGGAVSLEENSTVEGDVVLTGGSLNVSGMIEGSITAIGGVVNLNDDAIVEGDINSIGAVLNKSDGASVEGNITNQAQGDFHLPITPEKPIPPIMDFDFDPIGKFLWAIFNAFVIAAIAALVTMFASRPVERVASAISTQPVQTGLFGLLTAVVAPGLILILAITLILIPLALIGLLVLGVAVLFGWIAIGLEVGKRIAALLKVSWALPVAAGVGTLVLTLVLNAAEVIPCIGWLFPSAAAVFAMGAVLTTRFGTRWPTPWNNTGLIATGPAVTPPTSQPPATPSTDVAPENQTPRPPEEPNNLP